MTPIVMALPGSESTARRLARVLGASVGTVITRRFPDGESYIRIKTKLKKRRVIIVAALDRPDDKLLPLLFLASLARDLEASDIGLVCPYLPYMRQDKRFQSGEAVTSTYFARVISGAFDWLVTVDPHLHRRKNLAEIFSIPTVAAHVAPLVACWIRDHVPRPVLVGPDAESRQWVASIANDADAPFVILSKRRFGDRKVRVSPFHIPRGRKRIPVIVDDIASTARTMIEGVKKVRGAGGAAPCCIAIHALFAGNAYRDLRRAGAGPVVSCNTVSHASNRIDVTDLLADGVRQLISRESARARR